PSAAYRSVQVATPQSGAGRGERVVFSRDFEQRFAGDCLPAFGDGLFEFPLHEELERLNVRGGRKDRGDSRNLTQQSRAREWRFGLALRQLFPGRGLKGIEDRAWRGRKPALHRVPCDLVARDGIVWLNVSGAGQRLDSRR